MKQLLLSSFLVLALGVPASHAQTYSSEDTADLLLGATEQGLQNIPCSHKVLSTTQPILAYSNGRRTVHVSGVVLSPFFSNNGSKVPSPGDVVNVIADVGQGFVAFQQVITDSRGVYNVWFEAPAPIKSVRADSPSFTCTENSAGKNAPEGYNVMAGDQ